MVGVVVEDAVAAVDLFGDEGANEQMWPGEFAEAQAEVSLLAEGRVDTGVAADQDDDFSDGLFIAPGAEAIGQIAAAQVLAAFVENDPFGIWPLGVDFADSLGFIGLLSLWVG